MIEVHTKKQVRKKRLIPVAFPEFNQQSWHDKLLTPQSQEKKCKNPHTRVGERTEVCVWEVRSSLQHLPVYISDCFFQPSDFLNTTWVV